MKSIIRNKIGRCILFLLVMSLCVMSLSGCGMAGTDLGNGTGSKDIVDTIIDSILDDSGEGGGNGDSGIIDMLFDAFLGGNSSDFGWGESDYSGGNDNYIGGNSQNFQYADISGIQAGEGKATIMVYIIGSNLESENGCATMDIQEMCNAKIGDNVNLLIEAGGAKKWQNSVMASGKVGRYKVVGEGIQVLEERGNVSMVENSEVLDFIRWSIKNYPADRYGFIFWDHGGGTMAGFGMDDLHEGSLSLDEISEIFSKSGIKFDFIGFDACLMGTIETAYALSNSADYLIAAEEEEPGYGWYYTNWLKALDKNPSLDVLSLGNIIVDDFVAANGKNEVTLSLIALKEIGSVYEKLCSLLSSGTEELYAGNYVKLAKVRKNTKGFGEGHFDQIDIIDFCNKCGLNGADEVISAVKSAVAYHKTNIGNTNGLAMYFPYDYPSYYKNMNVMLKSIGMNNSSAFGFFNNFLSAKTGGSVTRSSRPVEVKSGYKKQIQEENYSSEDWFNADLAAGVAQTSYEQNEDGLLELTEVENGYVLELAEEDWENISAIDMGIILDDGEGYIDMGNDSVYGVDEAGNLIIDFNYNWVAVDGQIVPFRIIEIGETADGGEYSYGAVEARFTSARTGETRDIDILLYWDDQHDGGYVKGYRSSQSSGLAMPERNVASFVKGDKIQFVCDYYSYAGKYIEKSDFGKPITIESPLKVTYEEIVDYTVDVYGHITDAFGNEYFTESVTFTK